MIFPTDIECVRKWDQLSELGALDIKAADSLREGLRRIACCIGKKNKERKCFVRIWWACIIDFFSYDIDVNGRYLQILRAMPMLHGTKIVRIGDDCN